jgi:HK97 family phage portal protein
MPKTEEITIRTLPTARRTDLTTRLGESLRSYWLGPWSSKDKELVRHFGGTSAPSGVAVNEETAFNYSAFWCAVELISGDIAKTPLPLYKRLENGGSELFRGHPLYRLLHDEPNSEMGSYVFRRTMQAHVLVWRNAYAEIERNGEGRPVALWPLLPYQVAPYREGGVLRYRVDNPLTRNPITFPASDILHLQGLTADGITGYNLVTKARESLGLGMATERFGSTFFGNGATFGGVITFPIGGAASELARENFRKMLAERHQGVDKAHRLLAVYDGGEYKQMGVPPEAAQFLETRKFQIEEVARWFNLPVHKLKNLDRSTNNNIEHQSIEYVTDTLTPWFELWEQELDRKLIPRLERNQQFFEHITEGLKRGDSTAQKELFSGLFSVGSITQNEIRHKMNLNPLGTDGDVPFVPINMMPLDQARRYWDAQIDLTLAKAKPPEPPVVAPPPPEEEDDEPEETVNHQDLTAMEARLAAQVKETVERIGELTALRTSYEVVARERDDLRQEKLTLTDWLNDERQQRLAEHRTGEANAATLRVEMATLATERDALTATVDALRAQVATAQAEAEQHRHVFTTQSGALTEAYRQTEAGLRAEVERLTRDLDAERGCTHTLEEALDTARVQAATALDAALARASAAEAEQVRTAGAVEVAVAQAEAAHGLTLIEMTTKLDRLDAERADLLARVEASELAAAQNATDRAVMLRVQAERDRAMGTIDQLEATLQTTTAAHRGEVDTLTALVDGLRQECGLRADEVGALLTERDDARAELATVTAGQAAWRRDIEQRTEGMVLASREEIARLTAERDTLQAQALAATTSVQEWTDRCAAVEAERAALTGERTQRTQAITAMRGVVVDVINRLLFKECERARKAQATPEKFKAWIGNFYPLHTDACRAAFRPVVLAWAALTGGEGGTLLDRLVTAHIETSTRALLHVADYVDSDERSAALEHTLRRWETERAEAVADGLLREGTQ